MDKQISALVYLSKEKYPFTEGGIQVLAQKSARKNAALHISGYLAYKEGLFVQYLEGPKNNLNDLFHVIRADSRHQIFKEIRIGELGKRHFKGWDMRHLEYKELHHVGIETVLDWLVYDQYQEKVPADIISKVWQMVSDIASLKALQKLQ